MDLIISGGGVGGSNKQVWNSNILDSSWNSHQNDCWLICHVYSPIVRHSDFSDFLKSSQNTPSKKKSHTCVLNVCLALGRFSREKTGGRASMLLSRHIPPHSQSYVTHSEKYRKRIHTLAHPVSHHSLTHTHSPQPKTQFPCDYFGPQIKFDSLYISFVIYAEQVQDNKSTEVNKSTMEALWLKGTPIKGLITRTINRVLMFITFYIWSTWQTNLAEDVDPKPNLSTCTLTK